MGSSCSTMTERASSCVTARMRLQLFFTLEHFKNSSSERSWFTRHGTARQQTALAPSAQDYFRTSASAFSPTLQLWPWTERTDLHLATQPVLRAHLQVLRGYTVVLRKINTSDIGEKETIHRRMALDHHETFIRQTEVHSK